MIRRAGPWIAQRPRVVTPVQRLPLLPPLDVGRLAVARDCRAPDDGCASKTGAVATHNATPASERLAGTVRGSDATALVSGRTVAVVNVATGETRTTETGATGGFAIELPAGTYRVELALRDGETVVKRPDVVLLNHGGPDSHIEFVVAPATLARPRGPAYHLDNGLGSPSPEPVYFRDDVFGSPA